MKTFFAFLAACLLAILNASAAVDVTYTYSDFGFNAASNGTVTLYPLSQYGVSGTTILTQSSITRQATNGTVTFTNIASGYSYRASFRNFNSTTIIHLTNSFPASLSGSVNASDWVFYQLIVNGTNSYTFSGTATNLSGPALTQSANIANGAVAPWTNQVTQAAISAAGGVTNNQSSVSFGGLSINGAGGGNVSASGTASFGTFTGNTFNGDNFEGGSFSGDGSAMTNFNASNLASGTVDPARLPASVVLTNNATLAAAVTNQFTLPIAYSQIAYPTNFLSDNPCATNQVIVYHTDGTKTTNTAAANTDSGRGTVLAEAMDTGTVQQGDVFFVGAGRWDTTGYAVNNSATAIDLSGGNGANTKSGVHLVGKGKNSTVIDTGGEAVTIGLWTCVRDLTFTNFQYFQDFGYATNSVATNQFAIYKNCKFNNTNAANQFDQFISNGSNPNYWLESCDFENTYDVFAASVAPAGSNILISLNNTYFVDALSSGFPQPLPRVQYGSMARTCYIVGDTVTSLNGTTKTIGISAGESGKTNSTLYVWNTRVGVSANGVTFSKGAFSTSQIYIGPGCTFDTLGTAVDASTLVSGGNYGFTGIVTNWGTGITSNRLYYSFGIVTNVTTP